MKKILFTIVVLISCSLEAANKPRLYAILIADTLDDKLERNCRSDMGRLEESLHTIAYHIGYELKLAILEAQNASKAILKETLAGISASANDVVFFAYSGHGSRAWVDSPWPAIHPPAQHQDGLAGSAIVDFLLKGQQRLTIIIFDACNFDLYPKRDDLEVRKGLHHPVLDRRQKYPGIRKLFLNYKGYIIATSSKKGEYSYVFREKDCGSFFIFGFTQGLVNASLNKNPTWQEIEDEANTVTTQAAMDIQHFQHPLWLKHIDECEAPRIELSQDAVQKPNMLNNTEKAIKHKKRHRNREHSSSEKQKSE